MKEVQWTSALQTIKSEKQKERNEDLHLTSNITLWKREKICDTQQIHNPTNSTFFILIIFFSKTKLLKKSLLQFYDNITSSLKMK